MRHYPIFLNPEHLRCLVVGTGEVGLRKIGTLLGCGVQHILALDLADPGARLRTLLESPALDFKQRAFRPSDLDGCSLAFACTTNTEVNAEVGREARKRNVQVNVADDPALSTFIVPASVHQAPLTVAFSTGGASPAMARRIKTEMQEHFGPHYGLFLTLMERIRPLVLELGNPTTANTDLFRTLAASSLLDALGDHDIPLARTLLEDILPGELTPRIGDLLDGIE